MLKRLIAGALILGVTAGVSSGITQSKANVKINDLTNKNTELTIQLENEKSDKQKYYDALQESAKTLEAKELLNQQLNTTLEETRVNLAEALSHYQTVSAELTNKENELASANETIFNLQTNLETANNNITTLQSNLESANTNISSLIEEKENIQTELNTKQSRVAELESLLNSSNENNEELQAQITTLNSEIDILELSLTEKTTQLESVTNERDGLQTQLTTALSEKQNLQTQLDSAISSKNTLQNKVNSLTTEKNTLQATVNELTAENTALTNTISQLQAEIEELQNSTSSSIKCTSASLFKFTTIGDMHYVYEYVGEPGITEIVFPQSYSIDSEGNFIDGDDYIVEGITCNLDTYESVFAKCIYKENIYSLIIPEGYKYINTSAIYNVPNVSYISLPNTLEVLSTDCISGVKITSLILPSSLKTIESMAVDSSTLKHVYIPKSITSIGSYAFRGNSDITIFCECSSKLNGWDSDWNYSQDDNPYNVVYNATMPHIKSNSNNN